ncbi:MAG: UbiA prenyltransferase family protein [Flammeovirgaceae bacterium]
MQATQLIQLIRVRQWIKNLFVFIPPFFAASLTIPSFIQSLATFFAFSFVASSVYVVNDYVDIEQDRLHPIKKNRPLAAGAIHKREAEFVFVVLLVVGISIAIWLNSLLLLALLAGYFAMNIAYSLKLKHLAIIDILTIAIGFLLRVFAGAAVEQIFVSHWLILLTFLLALVLALGKRRGELMHQSTATTTRKVLEGYNLQFIDISLAVLVAITVVCYIMYTISEEVMTRVNNPYIYFSTIFVLLGFMRYFQQTFVFQRTESPSDFLLKDRFLQVIILLWIGFFAYILYYH